MPANLKIEPTALLDLGTKDIIQPNVQYKRKNTLQYQGLLSNMTKKSGAGFLSTTGKNITVKDDTIIIEDNVDITASNGVIISDTKVVHGENIIAASSNVYWDWKESKKHHQISWLESRNKGVVISIYDYTTEEYLKDHEFISTGNPPSSAAICATGHGFFYIWKSSGSRLAYVAEYKRYHPQSEFEWDTWSVSLPATSNNANAFTIGVRAGTDDNFLLVIGFDGGTPSTRFTRVFRGVIDDQGWCSYIKTVKGANASYVITGFGCVDEGASMVTGEPIPFDIEYPLGISDGKLNRAKLNCHPLDLNLDTVTINFDTQRGYAIEANASRAWTLTNGGSSSYDIETLNNGVKQKQRINPKDTLQFFTVSGDDAASDYSYRDNNKTWLQCLYGLGTTSEDYSVRNRQSGSADCPSSGSHCWKPRNLRAASWYNTDPTQNHNAVLVYVLYLHIDYVNNIPAVHAVVVDAETAGNLHSESSSTSYSQVENWTKYGLIQESLENQMGLLGSTTLRNSTETLNGVQLFPHLRWFYNDREGRGKTYDYGRGWMRCLYTNIYVRNMANYGYAVFESPLQLITADASSYKGTSYQNYANYSLDLLSRASPDVACISNTDCHASYQFTGMNESYPTNSRGEFVDEKEFFYCYEYTNGNKYRLLRLHPIRSAQLNSSTYTYNHTIGQDVINSLPFSVSQMASLGRDYKIKTHYYNNNPIAISYNGVLLFTPRDLSGDFSGFDIQAWENNYQSVAVWNKTTIQSVFFVNNTLKVDKLTDYIFKTNFIANDATFGGQVLVEDRNGNITLESAFYSYMMDSIPNLTQVYKWFKMPEDAESLNANDVWYQAAGINVNMDNTAVSSSFLLPAITLPLFVNTADTTGFNLAIIDNRHPLLNMSLAMTSTNANNVVFDEYYTHSQLSTDITYKNSYRLVGSTITKEYDTNKEDTSWWIDGETIIYPVGMASITYGENYITSTVDTGDNYVARFYNRNNKTFLNYNNVDQVYFGSEIFTIQSGNYYFDGQGIYYLGSQTDYSQNIFTAYAIGMKFLANSSSEAYFYSPWDKSLYLYTASNTLQKSVSFADCGNVVDALYSAVEQSFYILFDDGTLYIKTQNDDCRMTGVFADKLNSGELGGQAISNNNSAPVSFILDADDSSFTFDKDYFNVTGTGLNQIAYPRDDVEYSIEFTRIQWIDTGVLQRWLVYNKTGDLFQDTYTITATKLSRYYIFNPYMYSDKEKLNIETEWIGNSDLVSIFPYVDVILYSDDNTEVQVDITVSTLNGATVKSTPRKFIVKPSDWNNQLYRCRVVPEEPVGNAIKLSIESDDVSIFSMTAAIDKKSDLPSAPRKGRL